METFTKEELLKRLNFDMSECAVLTDDESSYLIICINNLTEKDRTILDKLNFDNFRDNLFISLNESFIEDDVIDFLNKEYVSTEENLWGIVLRKLQYVNEIHMKLNEEPLFNHSYGHILMPFTWKGKITLNESDFHNFIEDINKLFRESCINKDLAKVYSFWRIITCLRNEQNHDSTNDTPKNHKAYINKKFKAFNFLIDKDIPEYKIDYVNAQIKILKCFIKYLDCLEENLNVFDR